MKKILLIVVLLVSGCASMFSGTKETIIINTTEKDSKIYFNDEYVGNTAATVTISKKKLPDSVIKISKEGCTDTYRTVETNFNGLSLLGFPVWPVSIVLIDWGITGAVWEATQTTYILAPNCPTK